MSLKPCIKPNMQSYVAGGNLTAKQYHFVKFDTGSGKEQKVVIAGASDKPIGIVQNAPNTGEAAEVAMFGGGAYLAVAGAVAAGGRIKVDSDGKGVASSAEGDMICAVADAIGPNSSSGDTIPVLVSLALDAAPSAQAALVAALTGTLTGTANGSLVDVAATAGSCAGGSSPAASDVDTAIATAVASIVTGVNEQNKEIMTTLNGVIAALKTAGLMASA
jgi:hypothetical protein